MDDDQAAKAKAKVAAQKTGSRYKYIFLNIRGYGKNKKIKSEKGEGI